MSRTYPAMTAVSLLLAAMAGFPSLAEETNKLGLPNPEKPDVPYLIHASSLIETEQSEATEEKRKNEMLYAVPGANSGVQTPLASPEMLFRSENIDPRDLAFFRFASKNGRRELLYQKKKKILAEPIRISLYPVDEGLVKIRVDDSLQAGEYCLTPSGSNVVFCFAVF